MLRPIKTLVAVLSLAVSGVVTSRGCDLCGCYTPQLETMSDMSENMAREWWNGFYFATAEQFTHFGTLQLNGHEVGNSTGQYLDSTITQLVGGYTINDRFALQLNTPLIYREFKRPEGFAIDRGTESGFGDISILLKVVAFHYALGGGREFDTAGKNPVAIEHEPEFTASVVLLTAMKLPTGDTSRLEEEFHEIKIPGAPESGIHGHDLTLGTGSIDGIFGSQVSLRYKDFFADETLQFTLRGDGSHQYHFSNDLIWDGGPGYYFIRNQQTIAGIQFVVSGEHKDVDRFRGKAAEDTGITSLFVGPRIVGSRGRWSATVEVDLPVLIDNTSLQAVPDYRVRGGIAFHF